MQGGKPLPFMLETDISCHAFAPGMVPELTDQVRDAFDLESSFKGPAEKIVIHAIMQIDI